MKVTTAYTIPGLGFDHRIFSNLELNGVHQRSLGWLEPKDKESIADYAFRMSQSISPKEEPVLLIGHSFGGIMAQEMAQFRKVSKIILLSSIRNRKENAVHFKVMAPLRLQRLVSKKMILSSFPFWGPSNGYHSKELKWLFKSMVKKHSNQYLSWAMEQLSKWQAPTLPNGTSLWQIHGTHDKTFPYKNIRQPDFTIQKGDHLMVLKRAEEINTIIMEVINQ